MMDAAADAAWDAAVSSKSTLIWAEHLDRRQVSDHFAYVHSKGVLRVDAKQCTIDEWLNSISALSRSEYHSRVDDESQPIQDRLAAVTFVRCMDRLTSLLKPRDSDAAREEDDQLPKEGVLQYFSDELAVCMLVRYRRSGSTVMIGECLAFPEPKAFFDPRLALKHVQSDQKLELLRAALFSRYKLVVHRNTLTFIDRDRDSKVFGPSIDTLVLNEWLFKTRYLRQRKIEDCAYFEDMLPRFLADETSRSGTRFLDIGCGNGLLTATFARNEARIRRICAVDVSMHAIAATYRNSAHQRRLPSLGKIGDRGLYVVGRYSVDHVPRDNDLIVCNPPYIPLPPATIPSKSSHPLTAATIGTDLLEAVVRDSQEMLSATGQMVLVISDMAEQNLRGALPASMVARKVFSCQVPFDVASVRQDAGQQEWLKWLKTERGLSILGTKQAQYQHQISVFEIERAR